MKQETKFSNANQLITLTVSEFPSSNMLIALLTSPLQSCRATMHSSWFFPVTSISCWNYKKMIRGTQNWHLILILRFYYIKTKIMQSFHMKMASSRLWMYNPRSGLLAFCGDSMPFHQNWQSQATNQPSSKLTKHQILNQQHIYTYIPTFSEHSGSALWLLKLVHRPGIPKFLNYSNIKWDYIYFKKYWSGLLFPSSGDLPDPGIKPGFPSLQAESLQSKPPEKPSQKPSMSIWPQLPNIQSSCLHCTTV